MHTTKSQWTFRFSLMLSAMLAAACATPEKRISGESAVIRDSGSSVAIRRASYQQAVSMSEFRCMALNLYWEARGEGVHGMTAVGWVVLNRMQSRHFPATVCDVVYEGGETPPCQFSWWCDGRSDQPTEKASWRQAQEVATALLHRPGFDPTHGSLFYHSTAIRSPWLRQRQRTAQIGRHVFYR